MNQNIIYSEGIITEITLNRPDRLNSLNRETLNELKQALNRISENQSCKCAIIKGAGSRAFSAGADLEYLYGLKDKAEAGEFFDLMYSVFHQIELIEKPFIAAIQGYCLGGGNELAIACDIRIASNDSVFGQPETTLGIVPGGGAQHKLPIIIGKEKAEELISTGKMLNAQEALKIGLVSLLVNKQDLYSEAERCCWMSWCFPIGFPNWTLSLALFITAFNAPSIRPRLADPMPNLPLIRDEYPT